MKAINSFFVSTFSAALIVVIIDGFYPLDFSRNVKNLLTCSFYSKHCLLNCFGLMQWKVAVLEVQKQQFCFAGMTQELQYQQNDTSCTNAQGNCQVISNFCNGKYEANMCGGPPARQCCDPKSSPSESMNNDGIFYFPTLTYKVEMISIAFLIAIFICTTPKERQQDIINQPIASMG